MDYDLQCRALTFAAEQTHRCRNLRGPGQAYCEYHRAAHAAVLTALHTETPPTDWIGYLQQYNRYQTALRPFAAVPFYNPDIDPEVELIRSAMRALPKTDDELRLDRAIDRKIIDAAAAHSQALMQYYMRLNTQHQMAHQILAPFQMPASEEKDAEGPLSGSGWSVLDQLAASAVLLWCYTRPAGDGEATIYLEDLLAHNHPCGLLMQLETELTMLLQYCKREQIALAALWDEWRPLSQAPGIGFHRLHLREAAGLLTVTHEWPLPDARRSICTEPGCRCLGYIHYQTDEPYVVKLRTERAPTARPSGRFTWTAKK